MSKTTLKPCPFCGGKASVFQLELYVQATAMCRNEECAAEIEADTRAGAISAWNRRAKSATTTGKTRRGK